MARPTAAATTLARTAVVSLTMSLQVTAANRWRDLFNPLRGLSMSRLVGYLEEGERGAYADLQWLYRFVEKRDATLRGGKRSLLAALTEMDWEIKTVEESRLPRGFTLAQAEAQAVELRTAYDAVKNLKAALEHLGLAEFRGFSHLEKIEGAVPPWFDGPVGPRVVELRPVEQWHWCRDGRSAPWTYNPAAQSGKTKGEEVDLSRFIIREIDDPIDEIAAIAFVRKQLSRKDWDGFIESFGIPSIFAILPQNVPQGREAEYQDLAEQVVSDSRGTLPHGSDIKTVDAGARGASPFEKHLESLDKEIVMAITSGALTMLAESGSGTLAGGAHSATFLRVARALARRVTETMQQQFDADVLGRLFPGQPPLAYFEILANEEVETGEIIKDLGGLKTAGFEVDAGQVEEKTGYKVTKAEPGRGQEVNGQVSNRGTPGGDEPGREPSDIDDEFLETALGDLIEGMQADFKPVATRLQELLQTADSDEALQAGLAKLLEDLPTLAAEVGANDATVEAWENILGAAAGNEMANAE